MGRHQGCRSKGPARSAENDLQKWGYDIYGPRWAALMQAMASPTSHTAVRNHFAAAQLPAHLRDGAVEYDDGCVQCIRADCDGQYPPPEVDDATLLRDVYWLDLASLLPVVALDVRPGQTVLDMCAAPGGKSVLLAHYLFHSPVQGANTEEAARVEANYERSRGHLTSNEFDSRRRDRLKQVLHEYLPEWVLQRQTVTHYDAALYWRQKQHDTFDRILLDAPCTSDRHVVQQSAARQQPVLASSWSPNLIAETAALQVKLLTAAFCALKPGGRIVYSTCSVATEQNDGVIERCLQRCPGLYVLAPSEQGPAAAASLNKLKRLTEFEPTQHGNICLPDRLGGGPMFFCVMSKSVVSDGDE